MLTNGILGSVNGYIRMALGERVRDMMHGMIHAKALTLAWPFNSLNITISCSAPLIIDAIDRPIGLLDSISKLLQNTITLVAMAGVLLTFAWWLPLVLLLGTLPCSGWRFRTPWSFIAGGRGTPSTNAGVSPLSSHLDQRRCRAKCASSTWAIISLQPTPPCAGGCAVNGCTWRANRHLARSWRC